MSIAMVSEAIIGEGDGESEVFEHRNNDSSIRQQEVALALYAAQIQNRMAGRGTKYSCKHCKRKSAPKWYLKQSLGTAGSTLVQVWGPRLSLPEPKAKHCSRS